jgi:hypothetical protein
VETADAGLRAQAGLNRGLALLLVGEVDRRILPALTLAARLPELEPKAVHIATDPDESRQATNAWMALDLAWMPLHVEEPTAETFLACVQRVVATEAARRSRVLVIVPELDLNRWCQTLLHRSTGRRIARRLSRDSRVSTLVLPYPRW